MLIKSKMASIHEQEGEMVPAGLPQVIDAHVHVFPQTIFSAIWKWFDDNAWRIRYRMTTIEIFEFLLSRGVKHIIALQYAHKPGIARMLNGYLVNKCNVFDQRVLGIATVFPGEDHADKILQEAFDSGLGGLKLHAHVQCFDMNAEKMNCLYECCRVNNKPVIMHVGREPKSSAYHCDPYEICSVEKVERVLRAFPGLKICVPHLGFDEVAAYRKLIEKYDNLWLDTTMVIADYFAVKNKIPLGDYRVERMMYGSDFPNIPYAWDRELKMLAAEGLSRNMLEKICHQNAADFFNIDKPVTSQITTDRKKASPIS